MEVNIHTSAHKRFKKISYFAIFFTLCGSIIYLLTGNIPFGIVEAILSLLFILNHFMNHSTKSKIYILFLVGSTFFVALIYTGGLFHTGWLWSLTLPPIYNFILNKKDSAKIIAIYAISLLLTLLMQLLFDIVTAYTNYELLMLLAIYTLNSYLLFIFQTKLDDYNSKLTQMNIELKNKVAQEIEANEQKNKILSTQSKQAQMGEMVSMIAHQWRQPLNAISASAIKLKLENDLGVISSENIDKTSVFIQDRTQDMSEIINNFLDYSKPTNKYIHFSTTQLIDKTYKIIHTQFSLRGIFLTLNYAQNAKDNKIHGVENLLEQVILNLLINVRDAFDERNDISIKNIYISVDENNNIDIEDNAGGIKPDFIDKVFNPYFTTKEEGKGTGLGLYMSRKILRDNFHGDLIYTPLPDGTRFTIMFNTTPDESSKEENEYKQTT